MKKVLLALMLSLCIVAFVSCTLDETPVTKVDEADVAAVGDSNNSENSDANNVAKVGETLERGGIQFTFDSVARYIDDSDFLADKPDDGNEFVVLWFTVKNTTDEDYHVNMFYEDSYYNDLSVESESMLINLKGDSLWGDVAAGKGKVGYVAYQLPIDWKTIEFQYKPMFAGQESKLIFKATPEDIK